MTNNKISLSSDYLENTLLYSSQTYLTVNKGETVYGDYKILGQITAAPSPPADISKHKRAKDEVRIAQSLYNARTVQFKGLHETAGFITIRGDTDECFFNLPTKYREMLLISEVGKDDFL